MKTYFLIIFLLPITIFAAKNSSSDYEIFVKEQVHKQQQIIAGGITEVQKLTDQSERRAAEIESYMSWFTSDSKKAKKNSGVERGKAKINYKDFTIKEDKKIKISKAKVLIFVSFSMPETSLQQWLSDANRLGASVVIRGLLNNSFKDTAVKVAKLIQENKSGSVGGIEINPLVFSEYNINKVPAVVVIDEFSNEYDLVYGNTTLEYALKIISDSGGKQETQGVKKNESYSRSKDYF